MTRQALQRLQQYDWPGNVSELRAEVVRWALFAGDTTDERDLSIEPPVSTDLPPKTRRKAAYNRP